MLQSRIQCIGTPFSQCAALRLREPRGFGVRGGEGFALARREPVQRLAVDAGAPRVVHGSAYLRAFRRGFGLGFGALRRRLAGADLLAFSAAWELGFAGVALGVRFRRVCLRGIRLRVGLGFRFRLGLGLFLVGAREVALVFLVAT